MALIINLLCEERRPLYKVHDAFEKLDTELLFGEGIRSNHLNDDCLGRGLDAFYEIGPSRILRQVSLSLRLKEPMDLPFVHFDTTTRVFYGAYGFEGSEEEDPLDRVRQAKVCQELFNTKKGIYGVVNLSSSGK